MLGENVRETFESLNPYFIGLSILISITHDWKSYQDLQSLNPYFIGLSILIRGFQF